MKRRELVKAVLNGEIIPHAQIHSYIEEPMDVTCSKAFGLEHTGDFVKDAVLYAECFSNLAIDITVKLPRKTIEKTEEKHRYTYDTGVIWEERYKPNYCRDALSHPVNTPEQAMAFVMPAASANFDKDVIAKQVQTLKELDYFVQGKVAGAWSGSYYYAVRFEKMLEWLGCEPDAARAVINAVASHSIDAAKLLLDCGVDCIHAESDMGTGTSLLMSPGTFREFLVPWLQEITSLCHSYGAYFHLHSHGHIEGIMDDLVAVGVDMINPIGPTDNNDLAMFKRKWGDKITINGGISATLAHMTMDEMKEHIFSVYETGRVGGRFFPLSEGGIPLMDKDKLEYLLQLRNEASKMGYCQ